jgi:anti-sigma B factor antagonist
VSNIIGISERRFEDAVVLDVTGPITGREAACRIDAAVRRHARAGTRILVANLEGVPQVDLAGLGALVDAHITMRQARGAFRLACVTKRIQDLVVITRLLTVIHTFDSIEEAAGCSIPTGRGTAQDRLLSTIALAPIRRFLRRA